MAETNTCWSHPHLCSQFHSSLRRYYRQSKVNFASPDSTIDPCPPTDTFQSGGSITLATGGLVSCVSGEVDLSDNSGLGRWSGISLRGRDQTILTIITAYRVCSGAARTAPLGSAFLREHEYCRMNTTTSSNPRHMILIDLSLLIRHLQDLGHMIIVMLDANATLDTDHRLASFLSECNLNDLHSAAPAPSTYIGAPARCIDFTFGCNMVKDYVVRSGTLAYSEGPQSDHRGLYINLQLNKLFQHNTSNILPPDSRSLHTGNPEHVSHYNASMIKYYEDHNMVKRIEQLSENHQSLSREQVRAALIKWDNDQGRAVKLSESLLRKPTKLYRWSPTLRNTAIIRRYWILRLKPAKQPDLDYSVCFQC